MSYYPKQYPVLDKNTWEIVGKEQFKAGVFENTMLADNGPQVAPGNTSGVYTSQMIDAGQAVAWKTISWETDLPSGSAVIIQTRFGATQQECENARWSAPYTVSPSVFSLLGSRENHVSVAAARFIQIRAELVSGEGGTPTLSGIRIKGGLVKPACVGPMNHGIVEDGKPVFYWTRVEGADSYCLEISKEPGFDQITVNEKDISDIIFSCPIKLEDGTYYWRLRAKDGTDQLTDYSPTRCFTVGPRPHADRSKLQHPYLFFTKDELPAIKERLSSKHSVTWEKIKARADAALDAELWDEQEVLLTPGQHSNFHPLWAQVARGQLEPLSFAYLITGDEKYAAKARQIMLHLVGFSRWTGVPFGDPKFCYPVWQAALETAGMCKGIGTAYDWLYDYLSEDDRATVRSGLLKLGILPIVTSWSDPKTIAYVPRHQLPAGNWWSVCNSGGGIAALAILDDVPDADKWVGMIADAIRAYMAYPGKDHWNIDMSAGYGRQYLIETFPNWGKDGGYIESLGYIDYGLVNGLYFTDALKRVTGEDLSPHINRKLIDQPYYFIYKKPTGEAASVNFNDSGNGNLSDDLYALIARHTGSDKAKFMLDYGYPSLNNIHAFLAYDDNAPEGKPDVDKPNRLMTDIAWSVFRSGWEKDASLIAAKFTHGRGHEDIGQYVIHYKGYPFIIDPGVVSYADPVYFSYLTTSHAHNLALVDGERQTRANGTVLGFAEKPGVGIVEADLTSAYQDTLNSWTRTLIYLEPECFVVVDRLRSNSEHSYSWQIQPYGKLAVQPGIGATIYQEEYEMQVRLLSPKEWKVSTKNGHMSVNHEPKPMEYLSFEPTAQSMDVMFVAVFVGAERGRNVGVEYDEKDGVLRARIITPNASHILLASSEAEGEMSGWGVTATGSICAVTTPKNGADYKTKWVFTGSGQLKQDDSILAEASDKLDYRVGIV